MKFSSSEYPPYSKRNNKSNKRSIDDYTPKVKIPNYTTPVYSKPHTNSYSTASSNSRTESVYNSKPAFSSKAPNSSVSISRSTPVTSNNNQIPRDSNTYNNWNNTNMPDNMNDIYYPNNSNYNGPVGVPLMPLYGYDNYEDAEKDWGYFRQLHPNTAQRIMREVDEECDRLEYDGSAMFDEYPDKVRLGRMVDKIYEKMKDEIEEPIVYSESIKSNSNYEENENDDIEVLEAKNSSHSENINTNNKASNSEIETSQYRRDDRRDGRRDDGRDNRRPPVRSNNWLRDLIEILLYQELQNRRRRYRSRRRWF